MNDSDKITINTIVKQFVPYCILSTLSMLFYQHWQTLFCKWWKHNTVLFKPCSQCQFCCCESQSQRVKQQFSLSHKV